MLAFFLVSFLLLAAVAVAVAAAAVVVAVVVVVAHVPSATRSNKVQLIQLSSRYDKLLISLVYRSVDAIILFIHLPVRVPISFGCWFDIFGLNRPRSI